ncbi:unnamed protein product [Didymodactylos carnosus]|uniref:Uncharacterized protein n=1 Tax=Didymodactylos carnosus TaxID=1234261 RepID=A0A8S2VFA4_9BILA|nr:unnamed protein product [Didymodactylos carnosus]
MYSIQFIGKGGVNLKHIHNRCHLHNIEVEPKDLSRRKEYIRCDLSGDQRSITDAISMIRDMLKRDGPDAVKELPDFHPHRFIEQQFNEQQQYYPLSSEYSTQLPPSHLQASSNNPFATPYISHIYRADLTAKPLEFSSNSQIQSQQQQGPSYSFNKNTLTKTNGQIPQFDFVHQPTSGKKDKRQNKSFEFVRLSSTGNQDSYEPQHQQSSSSNSSSTSPHHKTKRSCPETKEIPTGTDEGYWISQVHLMQLNEHDRQEFQDILNKIEKIKLEKDKMKSKPHQQPHSSSYRSRKQNYPTQVFHRQRAQTAIPSSNEFDFNLKQHNPPQHFDILTSEDNQNKSIQKVRSFGTVYRSMDDKLNALSNYQKALEIHENSFPVDHNDLASLYAAIGSIYESMNDNSSALPFYQKLLDIQLKCSPPDPEPIYYSYMRMAMVFEELGQFDKAVEHAARALYYARQVFQSDSDDLAECRNFLNTLRENV